MILKALYRQVSDDILGQIASGQLKIGDRLPPESEFANELGISRSTLRLAFNRLEIGGVLRRRKRAGTEIIAVVVRPKYDIAIGNKDEWLGSDVKFRVEKTLLVHTEDIGSLRAHSSESNQWLEVYSMRTQGNDTRPFCMNMVYVPVQFADIEPALKEPDTSVFQIIEKTYGVSVHRVIQSIGAVGCPEREAQKMGLEEGEPVLRIEAAMYVQSGELMELSIALCDPARFQVQTDVKIN